MLGQGRGGHCEGGSRCGCRCGSNAGILTNLEQVETTLVKTNGVKLKIV